MMMVVTMAYSKYDSPFMLTKAISQDHNTIMYFLKIDISLVSQIMDSTSIVIAESLKSLQRQMLLLCIRKTQL
jgi:hypothetical protein